MNVGNDDLGLLVESWLTKAEHDLWMAETALEKPDSPGDMVSFHAQQCTEKCLKAALVWAQVDFPKTHNLRLLVDLLGPIWPEMPFSSSEASRLTLYAVSSRYPDEWREVSREEAEQTVEMAKRVREAVRRFLQTKGWKDA